MKRMRGEQLERVRMLSSSPPINMRDSHSLLSSFMEEKRKKELKEEEERVKKEKVEMEKEKRRSPIPPFLSNAFTGLSSAFQNQFPIFSKPHNSSPRSSTPHNSSPRSSTPHDPSSSSFISFFLFSSIQEDKSE